MIFIELLKINLFLTFLLGEKLRTSDLQSLTNEQISNLIAVIEKKKKKFEEERKIYYQINCLF